MRQDSTTTTRLTKLEIDVVNEPKPEDAASTIHLATPTAIANFTMRQIKSNMLHLGKSSEEQSVDVTLTLSFTGLGSIVMPAHNPSDYSIERLWDYTRCVNQPNSTIDDQGQRKASLTLGGDEPIRTALSIYQLRSAGIPTRLEMTLRHLPIAHDTIFSGHKIEAFLVTGPHALPASKSFKLPKQPNSWEKRRRQAARDPSLP